MNKLYGIVRGRITGTVNCGPLGIAPMTGGPYTVVFENLERDEARRQLRELRATTEPVGDEIPDFFMCTMDEANRYKPRPDRYSEWFMIVPWPATGEPRTMELEHCRNKREAVKHFRNYVKRNTARPATWWTRDLYRFGRLERRDFYKGKPAGGETVLRVRDL